MRSLRVGCKRKESIDRKWFAAHELHATHLLHNQSISRSSTPPAYVYFRAACTTMLHVTAFTAQPTVKQRKLKSFCSHNTAYALPARCRTWNVSILKLLHSYFALSMSRNGALFLAYEILRKVRTRIKTNLTPSIFQFTKFLP